MCRLQNIVMRDYQESGTTGQTDGRTDRQTDAGQSDPYVPLCFAGDTKINNDLMAFQMNESAYICIRLIDRTKLTNFCSSDNVSSLL